MKERKSEWMKERKSEWMKEREGVCKWKKICLLSCRRG